MLLLLPTFAVEAQCVLAGGCGTELLHHLQPHTTTATHTARHQNDAAMGAGLRAEGGLPPSLPPYLSEAWGHVRVVQRAHLTWPHRSREADKQPGNQPASQPATHYRHTTLCSCLSVWSVVRPHQLGALWGAQDCVGQRGEAQVGSTQTGRAAQVPAVDSTTTQTQSASTE